MPYDQLFASAGQQFGVDPLWVQAMSQQEDPAGDPKAVSPKGAVGNMQLMPDTAKELGVTDSTLPEQNIPAGTHYFAKNQAKYKDSNLALMAYNWGPGNVDQWIKNGANPEQIPEETKGYVKKVNGNYQKLKGAKQPTTMAENLDPIEQALIGDQNEKNLSSDSNTSAIDPIEQALSANYDESPKSNQQALGKKQPGYVEDIQNSEPTALVRGVGAATQIPAYAGNLAARVEGYLYGHGHNLLSSEKPYSQEQLDKFSSIQPFTTGDNISDQLVKVGAQLTPGVASLLGNKLTNEQYNKLATLQENGISGNLLYEPKTLPGKLSTGAIEGAIGGRLPVAEAGSLGAGSLAKAAPKGALTTGSLVRGAASGVGATAANEAFPNNPLAMVAGGLVAPAAEGVGNFVKGAPIDPNVAQLAKTLQDDYGIKIPSYQLSNNPLVARGGALMDRLGLTKNNDTLGKFNGALAEAIGAPAGESGLTPDVMKTARTTTSAGYNTVLDKIGEVKADALPDALQSVIDRAKKTITTNKTSSVENLEAAVEEIKSNIKDGKLSARAFKDLTNSHSTLDELISDTDNPKLAAHARMLESALYDTLKKSAAPEDVATLNDLDMKWKNMRTVQGLAAKADATGQVSPARLITPVAKSFKDLAYGGGGDLGVLAKGGQTFKNLSSSGTFENSLVGRALGYVPETALAGGGLTALAHGLPLLGLKGAAVYGMGKALGHGLTSDWYRNKLMEESLNPKSSLVPENPLLNYALPATATVNGTH